MKRAGWGLRRSTCNLTSNRPPPRPSPLRGRESFFVALRRRGMSFCRAAPRATALHSAYNTVKFEGRILVMTSYRTSLMVGLVAVLGFGYAALGAPSKHGSSIACRTTRSFAASGGSKAKACETACISTATT